MPRTARIQSPTGIYHVVIRGIDKRIIFADDDDRNRFIKTLRSVREKSGFALYAFCLMDNHVHFLMKEGAESLALIFKRLGASYVHYYNEKYELCGPLFQGRFSSEAIDSYSYFMDAIKYICRNPVKAGLCFSPVDYPWLRCSLLHEDSMIDTIGEISGISREEFLDFVSHPCAKEHIDMTMRRRLSDSQAIDCICSCCDCLQVQEIISWSRDKQTDAVKIAHSNGVSIRQFSRLTGISKKLVESALNT